MPNQTELNDKYGNNLSVTSNDPSIIQRDQSGNISPDLSKTVYIEPINWAYDNNSINKIIDTRFSYYKFPPRLILDDTNVLDEIGITDVSVSYNSRYKVESQDVPTIKLLVPGINGTNDINYGWNEYITEEEFNEIRAQNMYDPIVWDSEAAKTIYNNGPRKYTSGVTTRLLTPSDKTSPIALASKYYRAQEQAKNETVDGISFGRYWPDYAYGYYDTNSVFEGHFKKLKFTTIIDGMPQTKPGSFLVTRDLIDSKKSLQFNIQVTVSHLDNHARNTFAIRLVRNKFTDDVNNPYKVLKMVSSAEQGVSAKTDNVTLTAAVSNTKSIMDATQINLLKIQTQFESVKSLIDIKQLEYQTAVNEYTKQYILVLTAPILYLKSYNAAKNKKNQLQSALNSLQTTYVALAAGIGVLQKELNTAKFNYQNALNNVSVDLNSAEDVLNAQYTFLWSGKTSFKLDYILKSADMKLNDSYSIEMLALEPLSVKHELVEENTYWDIKEI